MCVYRLVNHINVLKKTSCDYLPSNVYPMMLTEAIFQKEAHAIEWLISTWPRKTLRLYDMIPLEDYIEDDYMTVPFEGNEATCLADCVILGLLKLQPQSRLKLVDFTGFDKGNSVYKILPKW